MNNILKFLPLALLLPALNLRAGPYAITNINVGVDSNSVAWGRVNVNNNNYVGWLNAVDATNALQQIAVSNNAAAIGSVGGAVSFTQTNGYCAPSNAFTLFGVTNGMGPGDFKLFNSNGAAWDAVWLSNGVPVISVVAPR